MTSTMKSVVVIGGGVAGLACATKLASTPGFDVTLLEASDRVGGRVKTAKLGEHSVELGAQWVHGEKDNCIFSLVNPFGVLENDEDLTKMFGLSAMFVNQHGEFLSEDIHDKVFEVMGRMQEIEESAVEGNEPLGQFATRAFWKFNEEKRFHESESMCNGILDWIHRFQNSIDGAESWYVTSCRGQLDYASCEGNPTISWKRPAAYNTLIEILLHGNPILDGNSNPVLPGWIHLGKEVGSIVYNVDEDEDTGDVVVHCNDGTKYQADHVVSTVSLGVLKEVHTTLFQPPLSLEKINAIENIGFGTVDKIFLEFSSAWWPEDSLGFNLVWDDCCKVNDNWIPDPPQAVLLQEDSAGIPIWCRSLLGFYTLKQHPTTLFTWVTGPPADLMETLDNDKLKAELVKVLQKFVGSVFQVPTPVRILRSDWKSNGLIRGSYSFRTIHSEEKAASASHLAEPIVTKQKKPVICFAGEATHSKFYSTVHGAYETGLREAERIINHENEAAADETQPEEADPGFCCTLLNLC